MSSPQPDSAILLALEATSPSDAGNERERLAEEVAVLFDRFRNPLLRYLSSFGLTLADCEEVLQEVFLSLFQHLNRGKPRDHIVGWLYRVSHNLAARKLNRSRRDSETCVPANTDQLAIDPDLNPEDRMARNQTQQHLMAVVNALPEQDRRCLFLRAEGLSYREIADILKMSLGGVSLSLSRSLARLSRCAERCDS